MSFRAHGVTVASMLILLAACGGGGGGSDGGSGGGGGSPPPAGSLSYVGATTPANLASPTVVPQLSAWLLMELGLSDGAGSGSIAVAPNSAHKGGAADLSMQKRVGRAKQLISRSGKPTAQAVTSEACSGGGTTEVNDDGLRSDGTGTVILTFRACVEDGVQLDGVFRTVVTTFDLALGPTDYTITLEGVKVSAGSASVETGGTMRIVVSVQSGLTRTTTHNTVARYSPENVYTRLQDFVEVEQWLQEPITMSYRGRFYQSQHGYVDVQTAEPVQLSAAQDYAVGGELRLAGTGNARSLVRFPGDPSIVSIAMDSEGDGMFERGLSGTQQQLLNSTQNYSPLANAGADLAISEGQSVTLDGSASRDWEGGALTYSWSVIVPFGADPVAPGSGTSFSFTPSEGGTYQVQLSVSDGQMVGRDLVSVRVRDNLAPRANAGSDRTTPERAVVTLDGSASSDPEGDTLQFTWTRLAAPAGSAAPASFSGVTAELTTDVPGLYSYELRVADALGSSTDIIYIRAQPVLASAAVPSFAVGWNTQPADLTHSVILQLHPLYSGPPLALTVTSDAPWVRIDTPNVTSAQTISISLDPAQMATLPHGNSRTTVRIVPSNGFSAVEATVALSMYLPILRQVSPYVVYTGQSASVALFGDVMDAANALSLDVGGAEVQGFTELTPVSGRIALPALAAGEYDVRVRNRLNIQFPPARLVVRDPPSYPDEDVAMPGAVQALEYDVERDVFYGVFNNNGSYSAHRIVRQQDGSWRFDTISVTNPRALTLTADGSQLLVTSSNCGVHELDVDTLQVLESTFKSSCVAENFGIIHGFANTQVMIGDSDQWSTAWRYPGLEAIPYLPAIYTPVAVLSYDRTRMIWAEGPSISPPREIYAFDTFMRRNATAFAPHDATTNFLRSNLAISGDGKRLMHREDVYNENLVYAGSLPGISGSDLLPALSRYGSQAVVLDPETNRLSLFDVAAGHTIELIQDIETLASDVTDGRLMLLPDDSTVFAFTQTSAGYRLFVRALP